MRASRKTTDRLVRHRPWRRHRQLAIPAM